MAHDADLESLNPEKTMIILTLNSIDPKEKMLEAVGQGKERMTDTVFRRMIGEHEAWLANNDVKGTAKARKVFTHKKDDSKNSTNSFTCWCCGDEGHFRDRCPKREKASANTGM